MTCAGGTGPGVPIQRADVTPIPSNIVKPAYIFGDGEVVNPVVILSCRGVVPNVRGESLRCTRNLDHRDAVLQSRIPRQISPTSQETVIAGNGHSTCNGYSTAFRAF